MVKKLNRKALVLTNAFSYRESAKYQVERLIEEFKKLDILLVHKTNKELLTYINKDKLVFTISPEDYDFIIYLDKDKYISEMLEKAGFRLFNSSKAIEDADDKMITHILLSNHGIKMPKTISYPLCYEYSDNREIINNVVLNFKFPFLIKENYGSLGQQVYLISNKAELIEKELELRYKPHLYQEFIKESSGVDYRVLLINHQVVASMKRVNPNSYKANIAAGGKGIKVEISHKMEEMAIKASKILKLDYCAVDFVTNKLNNPILIEVNSNAYFSELEKITKVNVAEIYAKHIFKTVYKE